MLRRILLALLTATAGVSVVVTHAEPAQAVICPGWSDQQAMANQPHGDCRSTWLVDPGVGQLMDRNQLLRADGLYGAHGFQRQWLWYAPIRTVAIDDFNQQWVGCHTNTRTGDVCAPDQVNLAFNRVIDNFAQRPLQLSSFFYDGRTIPRVCGNFLTPQNRDIHTNPVPRATVEKFDDRNRNGQRDNGEPGLGGWQFRVVRVSSQFHDQDGGLAGMLTTGADGLVELRFDGLGPGVYQIEEIGQDGWAPTTAPVRTIVVPDGAGDTHLDHLRFGNAQTRADLVKVEFSLVDPPRRMEAGQATEFVVRALVRNDGPADVTARDTVDVSVPADCTAEPSHDERSVHLLRGASATLEFRVRITCEDPSDHPMTFTDRLFVETPGVSDPDPGDNTVAFEHSTPVFDRAGIALSGTTLSCPARADKAAEFTCSVRASVSNSGPYGPVNADVAFAVTPPADCVAADIAGSGAQSVSLGVGESREVVSSWRLVCGNRSFHPVSATAAAILNHLHVQDDVPGDGDGSSETVVEIFEPADLAVSGLLIRCTEREANATDSECTASVSVTNHGSATDVAAVAALEIAPEPGCTTSPALLHEQPLTLQNGQTTPVTATWRLSCPTMDRHTVRVTASVRTGEPHAEDRDQANNRQAAVWDPIDVKPHSLPSSLNYGKNGLVPFAVLSTATFDAMAEADRSSLRFGVTGTENSVVSCASQGEDGNDDGRLDLICRADAQLLGLACDTTVLLMTGRTTTGLVLYGEDAVKVTGCN